MASAHSRSNHAAHTTHTKTRKKRRRRRLSPSGRKTLLWLVAIVLTIGICSYGYTHWVYRADLSKGMQALNALEQENLTDIAERTKKRRTREIEKMIEDGEISFYELLGNTMLVGDERLNGFVSYGLVAQEQVDVLAGCALDQVSGGWKEISQQKPYRLCVAFGLHDYAFGKTAKKDSEDERDSSSDYESAAEGAVHEDVNASPTDLDTVDAVGRDETDRLDTDVNSMQDSASASDFASSSDLSSSSNSSDQSRQDDSSASSRTSDSSSETKIDPASPEGYARCMEIQVNKMLVYAPGSQIVINSIFDPYDFWQSASANLEFMQACNEQLEALCHKNGWIYVNNDNLESMYGVDDKPLSAQFYDLWLSNMICAIYDVDEISAR